MPANALGEQEAFEDFLEAFHSTPATAYDQADTPQTEDQRIQNVNVRDDTVFDSPTITGTPNVDALTGTVGNDTINALASGDFIVAREGDDFIDGGPGNDTISTGPGDDTIVVGPGSGADTITDFAAGAGTDDRIDVSAFTNPALACGRA